MMRPLCIDRSLTGRMRVVHGLFGRMVLQVQERELRYSSCPSMPGRDPKQWREQMRSEGETWLSWRDATWNDLYELGGCEFESEKRGSPAPHSSRAR